MQRPDHGGHLKPAFALHANVEDCGFWHERVGKTKRRVAIVSCFNFVTRKAQAQ